MRMLGRSAGIELDYGVQTNWQPVDSQRVMLWARQFGRTEDYMAALSRRHFEERISASHRDSILGAAGEAGLDVEACAAMLSSDILVRDVWRSYGTTIHDKGIHSIPFFIFNSPLTDGGPFRSGKGSPEEEHGSGNKERFLEIFERLLAGVERARSKV
mmetsp:Transcript_21186/g.72947  ORF Transcript_21186/g.72947 Transcript_21186/m.72947 type:complete len:158 (-) Transcript_21186:97-570(-)